MAETPDLESRIRTLEDLEAIKNLKYKYARCLDSKDWDTMAECFVKDATTNYADGKYQFQGVEAIMAFLKENLGSHERVTIHQNHHPEIDVTSETSAKGTWVMYDYVIEKSMNLFLRGAAFYHDEYVRDEGRWKIKSTGYSRIFEEMGNREGLALTAVMEYGTTQVSP